MLLLPLTAVAQAPADRHFKNYIGEDRKLQYQTGVALARSGQWQEAAAAFKSCYDTESDYRYITSFIGKDNIRPFYTRHWLAWCYHQAGDDARAMKYDMDYAQEPVDRSTTMEVDDMWNSEVRYKESRRPEDVRSWLAAVEQRFGANSVYLARMLRFFAQTLAYEKNCAEAVPYLARSMTVYKQAGCYDALHEGQLLRTLANIYARMGYAAEAARCYELSVNCLAKVYEPQSTQFSDLLASTIKVMEPLADNDALLRMKLLLLQTFPDEAEREKGRKRDELIRMNFDHEQQSELMEEVAQLTLQAGDTLLALKRCQQTLDFRTAYLHRMFPDDTPDDIDLYPYLRAVDDCNKALRQKAMLLLKAGRSDDAFATQNKELSAARALVERFFPDIRLLQTAEDLTRSLASTTLNGVLNSLNSKTRLLLEANRLDDALTCALEAYRLADSIRYDVMPRMEGNNEFYASRSVSDQISLMRVYSRRKEYDKAFEAADMISQIVKEMYDDRHDTYITLRYSMAQFSALMFRKEEATSLMSEFIRLKSQQVALQLSQRNRRNREVYWQQQAHWFEELIPGFVSKVRFPELIARLYDVTLFMKGLLLNTEMEVVDLIAESDDSLLNAKYQKLQHDRMMLLQLYQTPQAKRTVGSDSLEAAIHSQEYELMGGMQRKNLDVLSANLQTSWRQVRQHLGKKEAAVEFLTVPKGDSVLYIALTLHHNDSVPELTELFTHSRLVALSPHDCYETTALYDMLWGKMEQRLKGVGRVYFSPAGLLHRIGIEYLPGTKEREYVRLSSTRELVRQYDETVRWNAMLYGGLQYERSEEEGIDRPQHTNGKGVIPVLRDLPTLRQLRSAVAELPILEGTYREVMAIDSLLDRQQIPVKTMTGEEGTEESFKALSGGDVTLLHISTHGFYLPDDQPTPAACTDDDAVSVSRQSKEDLSLSRSGLLLAGVSDGLLHDDLVGEDGILTAKEIARMDLRRMKMVVLSACETGLGDINGEGVFGLQRAFKKAGAQSLLVSMWKVDDEATQILMTEFYRNLINGHMKRQALLAAQQHLRGIDNGKYDKYEYWAAFVLLDAMN